MATSFLNQFFDIGLLPGVDDANLAKLEAAATKLGKTLSEDADLLRRYSYALLDAELPENDPVMDSIETAIKEEWKTFRGPHPARPVQLLRGVLGEAVARAVPAAEFSAETILWLTASSVLPHANLGSERQLITRMFEGFGCKAEEEALSAWDTEGSLTSPTVKAPPKPAFKIETAVVNEEALAKHLKAAAGPNDQHGATGPNPNGYWPQNNPQHWVGAFGDRAASGISEVIDKSLADLAGGLQKGLGQVSPYLDAINVAVLETFKLAQAQYVKSVTGSETRLKLLWWKESLYSPSLKIGYRRMENPISAVVALACDCHDLLPDTYPHSAEYFLREVVFEVLRGDMEKRWTLTEFSSQVVATETIAKRLIGLTEATPGRVPLLVFLGELVRREVKATDAPLRVGISKNARFSADDLAVWMVRELHASWLASPESHEGEKE